MNERIKELLKQASVPTAYVTGTSELDADGQVVCVPNWDTVDPRVLKFAELIINDFLSICEDEAAGYVKLRKSTCDFEEKNIYAEGESASDRIRILTKKKFGVK